MAHDFDDRMAEHAFAEASRRGLRSVAGADAFAAQVMFCPSFHPPVSVTFTAGPVGGTVDVARAADTDAGRLRLVERIELAGDAAGALVERLGAVRGRPRARQALLVLDGMCGATSVRFADGTLSRQGGHFGVLLPDDPVVVVAVALLDTALAHARTRPALRAAESVAAYLDGFEPVRVHGGPPWTVRIVEHLTSHEAPALHEALARVGPSDEVTIDLADCELVAGMFWEPLVRFDRSHPRTRWKAGGTIAEILRHHGIDPDRIEG